MERIGNVEQEQFSENELAYKWDFNSVTFNKSYRSKWLKFLPYKNISGCQLAIVPDNSQHVIQFFLFMYGCEGQGETKITFNASLRNKIDSDYNVLCTDKYIDLETSMKVFEIHSSHPIIFNCSTYVFILELKLCGTSSISSSLSNPIESIPKASKKEQSIEHSKQVIQDLKSLFISGEMNDMKIYIGEDVLFAHKLILSARSPVFKKMMEHDCLESSSNSITITDCEAPLFQKFLKYLYTGEVEDSTMDTVMSLYILGDKYDVTLLQEACSNLLQSKFSSESFDDVVNIVCDVLILSERHNDSKLKDFAANFIIENFPKVSDKQSWKCLMKSNIELASEILTLVASGLHKKVYKID